MKIPRDRKWTQLNDGNTFGVLHETQNMNVDRRGDIKLSRKAMALIDSQTTDFGEMMSIVFFDGKYHLVTDDKVFEGDLNLDSFSVVASSPTLGTQSDGIACFDRLYVSDTTSLAYLNTSGSWTTGIGTLVSSYPHPLCVFDSLPTYKLAVGDGYQVRTFASDGSENSTILSLPQNYVVTTMVYRNGYLYVGTKEVNGGEAAIFLWNGSGTSAQYKTDVGAAWVYSMCPYRGGIACVTNEGELLAITGVSVKQLAAFPVFFIEGARWETGNATRGKVYHRALIAIGDNLMININGDIDAGDVPEMRSGLWYYNPELGLSHYATASTDLWVSDNGITASNSVITTSTAHGLVTGDVVTFSSILGLTGLSSNTPYYAIVVSTTTLKVSGSRKGAYNGSYVTITGTASTDTMNYAPNDDFGEHRDANSGAIAVSNYLDTPNALFGTDILFGSQLFNPAGTSRSVLCVLSQQFNIGFLTTQKVHSDQIKSTWNALCAFIEGLEGTGESAVLKYRTKDFVSIPTPAVQITWINATKFTTTDTSVVGLIERDFEVMFVSKRGQGRFSKVRSFSQSLNVTEVTIADSIGSAGTTSYVRFNNFKEISTIRSTRKNKDFDLKKMINTKNSWIQFKIWLSGFEITIPALDLNSNPDKLSGISVQ